MFDWLKNYWRKHLERKRKREEEKANRTIKEKFLDNLRNLFWAAVAALILKTFVIEAYTIPTGSMEDTLLPGDFLLVTKFTLGATTPRNIPFTNVALPYYQFPKLKKVKRGDIIVFEYPGDRDELRHEEIMNYIKRCVGLPGDTITIVDKVLYVNGELFPPPPKMKFLNPVPTPKGIGNPFIFPKFSNFNEDNYGPLYVPKKGDTVHLSIENIEQYRTLINREYKKEVVKVIGDQITIDGVPTKTYVIKKNYYFMMGDNRDDSADSRFWGYVPEDLIIGEPLIIYWSWDKEIPLFPDVIKKLSSIRLNRIAKLIHN
ncbi:MAG: signal peptidase I [Ignavibacteria bacterium]